MEGKNFKLEKTPAMKLKLVWMLISGLHLLLIFNLSTNANSMVRLDRWVWNAESEWELFFTGSLDTHGLARPEHWQSMDSSIRINQIIYNPSLRNRVIIRFVSLVPARHYFNFRLVDLRDVRGELLRDTVVLAFRYQWKMHDLVIHEIMADPTPSQRLPELEWLEIRNRSPFPINMMGCKLGKVQGLSGSFPERILLPDSVLLICSSGSLSALAGFGSSISVTSFPSLVNTGDQLMLWSPNGEILHVVRYSDDWYRNEVKRMGGWTLEMIDAENPCGGPENWMASSNVMGGTPGKLNSVSTLNPDLIAPKIRRVFASDSNHIQIVFSEPLNSADSIWTNRISIDNRSDWILASKWRTLMYDEVELKLSYTLRENDIHTLEIQGIKDCTDNENRNLPLIRFGLAGVLDSGDVVLNEIMFNPPPEGADYLELYNRSSKIIQLSDIVLGRLNDQNELDDLVSINAPDWVLLPDEMVVMTTDPEWIQSNWKLCNQDQVFKIDALPGMYDEAGKIRLLSKTGKCIDALDYDESWHFPLLTKFEGISLERISVSIPTQQSSNWHSAASTINYGTPTCRNSQSLYEQILQDAVVCIPKVISPNNDGQNDILHIRYEFPDTGMLADVQIYDDRGQWVRDLVKSHLCARTGSWTWNGLLDHGRKLNRGAYIVFVRVIGLTGKLVTFKRVFYLDG